MENFASMFDDVAEKELHKVRKLKINIVLDRGSQIELQDTD